MTIMLSLKGVLQRMPGVPPWTRVTGDNSKNADSMPHPEPRHMAVSVLSLLCRCREGAQGGLLTRVM